MARCRSWSTIIVEGEMSLSKKVSGVVIDPGASARRGSEYLTRIPLAVIAFGIGLGVPSAYAAVSQDGRVGDNTAVDGSEVLVTGNNFGAKSSNQCVLYSTLVFDATSSRHVEAGVVRCGNSSGSTTIDSTCRSGHLYVERYAGGNQYFCNEGDTFVNGSAEFVEVVRASATSTSLIGYVGGTSLSQAGFALSDSRQAYAWAEATGGSSCPTGTLAANFTNWSRKFHDSWGMVPASSVFHGNEYGPCWSVGSLSGGDFNVN